MKARRQRKILDIIRREPVETQEDLAAALERSGIKVTQATISRDIKELGLIKIPAGNNTFRYAVPGESPAYRSQERLKRLFQDTVVGLDCSENLVVIKTQPGGAQAVASAIDHAGWREIIGTVGGDDTILVVVKPKRAVAAVVKRFEDLNRG
ncbi:MAG: arginine repressor [Peptococcaceae bacterium]|nr:arginine repressor [Peptococcaceae bacterium]